MTYAGNRTFDDDAPEADAVEQLTPVTVDDDDMSELGRVRISPDTDADEADLIEQATAVPFDDDLDFDR
ncbi:hypothetical protein BTO20_16155 [Mycobacterium dioxanotrophicus]|jgi:hypothetical protein|uniref:Uncharacterized protein n=1 Tax=Mycobacterium dioxanotrophicus TaxID=482462 RepID=A0A1Y0C475_9MYCO|nr:MULTISPECIES: hypothetical protein [Mycobacterium]ART69907.1 hypothetical protein BTO20_16155 [Mycobacterium dioxanotrophicus]OBC06217.1 hypothetical protein A5784_09980 [Mycobacterium sp. 852013-50091_SCH5140682]